MLFARLIFYEQIKKYQAIEFHLLSNVVQRIEELLRKAESLVEQQEDNCHHGCHGVAKASPRRPGGAEQTPRSLALPWPSPTASPHRPPAPADWFFTCGRTTGP